MGLDNLVAFALAMALLAASPGPGLAAVLSRSISSGFEAGMRVVLGLVLVDFLFLGIAIIGLSAISEALGPFFHGAKYIAAAYLIYLGIQTARSTRARAIDVSGKSTRNVWADIVLGSAVTLGNPKAILFYSALLPTFFDVSQLGMPEFLAVCAVIVVVSGAVYGTYIAMVGKTLRTAKNRRFLQRVQVASGFTLVGTGVAIAVRE